MYNLNNLPLFSFFKAPASNTKPLRTINLLQLHKAITSNYYASITTQYREINTSEFKRTMFDYVTFNGVFSKRNDASLITPSGYMVLDIDKQQNIAAIRDQLINDTQLCPALIFVSPSGNGLKVVVDIDIGVFSNNASKKLLPMWQAVNSYLAMYYSNIILPDKKGNYIDPSGCDLSRACFICHDPNCFINNKITKI